jgi:hypothetical protein
MDNKDNEVRLKKIPLDIFIQALMDIYNSGIDYVDIIGKNNEEQDIVGIAFCDEYMGKDVKEETFEELKEKFKNIKLSDDDLNQLL